MKRTHYISTGTVGTSSLVGGLTSTTFGGDFWDGARQGATSAALNHLGNHLQDNHKAKNVSSGRGDGAVLKPYEPDIYDKWSESNNFFAKLSYDLVDGVAVTMQSFVLGPDARHLNGSVVVGSDRTDAFVNTASWSTLLVGGGSVRPDYIRTGNTVVSNQLVIAKGVPGATITWGIKGGGKNMSFHYHIHKYNWNKPYLWFKNTPIIKPK